ncbi:hypothetical protein HYFRA_00008288 [Hymenoscyphus fraxineus]|uniref:F-box domain-containing protein n=1 Tax=Hymenoscyphus fraxineus TaxID=746836 RepID=A0A9N9KN77_9HELO|nr:hypothetical protein HYFRA_00008288 [Hymenoscyphus fraxineus]
MSREQPRNSFREATRSAIALKESITHMTDGLLKAGSHATAFQVPQARIQAMLPPEIWRMVSKHLTMADLVEFRQVCKMFASLGLDLIVQEINLLENPKSIAQLHSKLQSAAASDAILRNTQTLRLYTCHADVHISQGVDFALYSEILAGYKSVRDSRSDCAILMEALSSLQLLNKLVIKSTVFATDHRPLQPADYKELTDAEVLRSWTEWHLETRCGWRRKDISGRALACAALAIREHALKPKILKAEIGLTYLWDKQVRESVKYLFGQLEEITLLLNLSPSEHPWGIKGGIGELLNTGGHLGKCFEGAERVKTINVTFSWDDQAWWEGSLKRYFGKANWPNIHTLQLSQVMCHPNDLLEIIRRNGSSLRNLILTDPLFEDDQFPPFFRSLRECTASGELNLERLEIRGGMWEVKDFSGINLALRIHHRRADARPKVIVPDRVRDELLAVGLLAEYQSLTEFESEGNELGHALEEYVLKGGKEVWDLYWPKECLRAHYDDVQLGYKDIEKL